MLWYAKGKVVKIKSIRKIKENSTLLVNSLFELVSYQFTIIFENAKLFIYWYEKVESALKIIALTLKIIYYLYIY